MIIDFLWTEPSTLLSCALTCKAFLPASQYHLQRQTALTIRNELMLKYVAHVLSSTRRSSRRLFELVETLRIVEDPARPFVRTVPFRLRADALPNLTRIVMENIDWTSRTQEPHPQFIERWSFFHPSMTRAVEFVFRFRRESALRDIVSAFKRRRSFPVSAHVEPLDLKNS
ncbi:hypothetical protein DAEQUDRAFT_768993 [Daedalea quercina L-15889]|uniref:F-box domain-containing protein n=1 Tax=Daedalea quercina L-15889 TaxID=1314783 RepID=A0A165M4P5_9APHY|nr:hypothetical protein DAEQUDRAFT_768993 [Daedalea quercina L-15889]